MSSASLQHPAPRPFTLPDPVTRRGRLWLSAYCATALASIFWLPYLFPVQPSFSFSYAYGYNNRVGILLTLLFAGAGALWLRRSSLLSLIPQNNAPLPRRTLLLGLAATLLLCAAAYPLVRSPSPVEDAGYLINRMQLLAAGQKPYTGFEFAYGPLLLYPPVWIARLFHLRLATAYYAYWVLNELAGVLLLFRLVRDIDIPGSKRSGIFLLFCAASGATFVLGGLNYTLTRFALAPWLAFSIHRLRARGSWPFALAALSYALLLLVSPEVALSFAVGILAFFLLGARFRSGSWCLSYLAMAAAIAATTAVAMRAHLFATLLSFAGGALDFPAFPSGHLLLFLACVFLSVLHLARQAFRRELGNSACLVLISLPMLASALGCCDPLHVFYGGFGLLLIGLFCLSQSKKLWDAARLAFFLFFVLVLFAGIVIDGRFQYQTKLRQLFAHAPPDPQVVEAQAFPGAHGILEAPFGFRTPGIDAYSAPWIDTGRYLATINAHSLPSIADKVQELQDHPDREVLVPAWYEQMRRFDADPPRPWLEVEYAAPFWMPLRNPANPWAALCAFLDTHYHRVLPATAQSFGYELWTRNP